MNPAWKITVDKVSEGDLPSRIGWGQGTLAPDDQLYTFKLYDDDGEHYYSGVCNAEAYHAGDDDQDGAIYNARRRALAQPAEQSAGRWNGYSRPNRNERRTNVYLPGRHLL